MNSEVSGFLLSQGISEAAEHLMQSEAGTIVVTRHWRVTSVFEIWVSSSPWVAMWYDVHDWIHDCKFGDGVFGHWLKAPTSARSCAVPYPHVRVSYWQHSLPTKLGVTDWFWLSQSSFLHAIEQLEAWYRFPDAMVSSLGMHKTSKHIWSSLKHRFPSGLQLVHWRRIWGHVPSFKQLDRACIPGEERKAVVAASVASLELLL